MTAVERNRRPDNTVLETVGWTPLIRLHRVTRGLRTPVYGKAEFFNPGGSVKDRIGLPIPAALQGYKRIFTMPDKMSQEKVRLLKAFGAQVIVTPTAVPPDHPDNYVLMAKRT